VGVVLSVVVLGVVVLSGVVLGVEEKGDALVTEENGESNGDWNVLTLGTDADSDPALTAPDINPDGADAVRLKGDVAEDVEVELVRTTEEGFRVPCCFRASLLMMAGDFL